LFSIGPDPVSFISSFWQPLSIDHLRLNLPPNNRSTYLSSLPAHGTIGRFEIYEKMECVYSIF
jgi:hypothetical protein